LPEPTDLTDPIFRTALELARPEVRGLRIRLLGVTASGLGEREQLSLFAADDPRRRKVTEAADAVRHRFGERAITRARLVGSRLPAPFERDPMTPVDPRSLDARESDGDGQSGGADGEDVDPIEPVD
jgi:DNA polymerase-4